MDVAVTGSSGLIGSALVASLEADGHRVRRVVRRPVASGESAVRWDPATGDIDAGALEGVDAVVHLAGAGIGDKRWSAERKREIIDSRTRGTVLLAGTVAELEHRPAVLLSGSAIGFYGDRGDEVLTEASAAGDGFLAEVCTAWEAAARPAVDAGIRTAFLRTGLVQAREGGALAKVLPLFRFGLGGKLGAGAQWWSWITIDDEVRAIRFLLDHEVSGPVNLVGPSPRTNADYTRVLGRVLGRPTVLPVPAFGPRLALGRELADQLLFASQRVLPTALTDAGFAFAHEDLEQGLRAVLGRPG